MSVIVTAPAGTPAPMLNTSISIRPLPPGGKFVGRALLYTSQPGPCDAPATTASNPQTTHTASTTTLAKRATRATYPRTILLAPPLHTLTRSLGLRPPLRIVLYTLAVLLDKTLPARSRLG